MIRDKKNIAMYLACILLCLVLITIYMTSGLYARYTAEGTASDNARVAKFDVTDEVAELKVPVYIAPDDYSEGTKEGQQVLTVDVTNSSEVAAKYSLSVVNRTNNIQGLAFKLYNASGTEQELPALEASLPPNDGTTHIYHVYVQWSHEDALDYMGMVDLVEFKFKAEQID